MVFYDIVAAFVHASIDVVVGLFSEKACWKEEVASASRRWQRHCMRVLGTHGWSASKVMLGFFHHRDLAGTCGCHGDDFMADGSGALSAGAEAHDSSQGSPCCLDLQTLEL